MPLSKAAIKRLSHKAGVTRIPEASYAEINEFYSCLLAKIVRKAVKYAEFGKRKTIKISDVELALGFLKYPMFKPTRKEFDFPKATIKSDINAVTSMRVQDVAVDKLLSFMNDLLIESIPLERQSLTPPTQSPPSDSDPRGYAHGQSSTPPTQSPPRKPSRRQKPKPKSKQKKKPRRDPSFSLSWEPDILKGSPSDSDSRGYAHGQSDYSLSPPPPPKKKKKKKPALKRSNATASSLAKKKEKPKKQASRSRSRSSSPMIFRQPDEYSL